MPIWAVGKTQRLGLGSECCPSKGLLGGGTWGNVGSRRAGAWCGPHNRCVHWQGGECWGHWGFC